MKEVGIKYSSLANTYDCLPFDYTPSLGEGVTMIAPKATKSDDVAFCSCMSRCSSGVGIGIRSYTAPRILACSSAI
jgi:hypothetical protein